MKSGVESVFFDIDGTLVDSNDAHARSWVDAFAETGLTVAFERIRPLIGMGGDKLLQTLDVGISAQSDATTALLARRKAIFLARHIQTVTAFPGARELVAAVKVAHLRCVIASSSSPEELDLLLEIAGVTGQFDHAVKPAEAGASKPDPDVIAAALAWSKTEPRDAVMIGDTEFDIDAAHRADVRCIALRCGGASSESLRRADAVFDSPATLATALEEASFEDLFWVQPAGVARRPS